MTTGSPMLANRRAPADHDTQACCLGPSLCHFQHFYHGWYMVAIPDQGVVYDLRVWHRCDWEQSHWLFMNCWSKKKKIKFLKVRYPVVLCLISRTELVSGFPVSPLEIIFTALFWDFISAKAGHILIKIRLSGCLSGCIESGNCSYLRIEFSAVNLNKSISCFRNSLAENIFGNYEVFI